MTQSVIDATPRTIAVDRHALAERSEAVVVDTDSPQGLRFLSCGPTVPRAEIRIVPKPEHNHQSRLSRAAGAVGLGRRTGGVPVGEIQVRCPYLFEGYFRNPDATLAGFDGEWFKSGDIGFLLDGELYVCGRIKEMLIVHGRNFYANDIEAIVNTVPGVKPGRVVAVGVYEASTASEEAVVMAETVLTDPASRGELATAIKKAVFDALNLALRHVEISPEATLIKTTSGKISRDENIKRLRREMAVS
jgi:acyl-CoA synthetase (AMP-forming)/AMP-acid ligase II